MTIAVCIIVLKKNKSEAKTFFIDASNEFAHEGNKNLLSPSNITNIHKAFAEKKDIPHFARLVDNSEISENKYNISVSTYVEKETKKKSVNIAELNSEIERIVKRENELRASINNLIRELAIWKP